MKWINKTTFQVSEDTPKRVLRGLTRKESKSSLLLLQNGLKERRSQVQKEAEERKAEIKANLAEGLCTQEQHDSLNEEIDKTVRSTVRILSQFLGANVTAQSIERMANMLTVEGAQKFEYEHIKIIFKDFGEEKEYENLTQGEVLDIINTIGQLTNLSKEQLEKLGFLSDSSAPTTANGAAPSVGNTVKIESETVMAK